MGQFGSLSPALEANRPADCDKFVCGKVLRRAADEQGGDFASPMPLAPESFQPLDDALSRLAAESILAQSGRDDGLIPSYSLLGELRDHCSGEPVLAAAISSVHGRIDRLLDAASPFDAPTLVALQHLISWLPGAVEAVKGGRPPSPWEMGGSAPAAAASTAATSADGHSTSDVLLELNLGENQELLSEFHAEAVDHLQQIEAALLILDQQPDNPEALNSIFRSFHTIKGNAGFLGLVPMHTLAHEVESLLDLARNRELRLKPAIITEILRSRDALQLLTQQIALALEKGHLPKEIIPVSHLIRAVKVLAVPDGAVPDAAPASPAAPATEAPPQGVKPGSEPAHAAPAAATPLAPSTSVAAAANAIEAQATGKTTSGQTVRVNTEKLDSLMDVVGELVIVQSQLIESARSQGDASSPLQRNVAQLSRITKELQHTAMSLRMIPIKPTFQKMERLSRDLARNFGKQVHFNVSGEDTELDRTVVEEIADPLVHMVRNALDHGLELPDARIAAGKPAQGTVHLRAYHQGSNIVIELQDDGRGIDPDKIFKKAVEKGIIAPNAQLSREECFALIFAPASPPPRRSPPSPVAASAWTWSSATSRSSGAR
jgi:two-component system, chemotaxis family, sensor kinase CheA